MESSSDISSIIVVFGRPGAGKSTISASAIKAFEEQKKDHEESLAVNGLDLDVCVPDWMKINFSKGIYPTLQQRNEFAVECCKYVKSKLDEADATSSRHATIISFSFVNSDLRDIFRSNFPNAVWVLIDTSEEEATRRIQAREDHFYKGDTSQKSEEVSTKTSNDPTPDVDNSDWKFAIVDFEHTILDGKESVEKNVSKLMDIVKKLPVASA